MYFPQAIPIIKPTSPTPQGFFSLPAELRNEIYHLSAIDGIVTRRYEAERAHRPPPYCYANLLHLNRQMRSEANAIYYSTNAFRLSSLEALRRWISMIQPANLALVTHLCCDIPVVDIFDISRGGFLHKILVLECRILPSNSDSDSGPGTSTSTGNRILVKAHSTFDLTDNCLNNVQNRLFSLLYPYFSGLGEEKFGGEDLVRVAEVIYGLAGRFGLEAKYSTSRVMGETVLTDVVVG
ncbi:hypothetical protein LTS18_000167 [Coniosporium uncinatum]|uniref:Uncharacterized protein n=1 Tax=Coniosporium uncinatum TaxID=93489 RepID=A0ACC3D8C5_9PEZI|nr:hypothetical protein LTS18_000167 [Coniosporium uncinatum]